MPENERKYLNIKSMETRFFLSKNNITNVRIMGEDQGSGWSQRGRKEKS